MARPNKNEIKKLIEQKRNDPVFMQRLERIFNENKEVLIKLAKKDPRGQSPKNKKPPTL